MAAGDTPESAGTQARALGTHFSHFVTVGLENTWAGHPRGQDGRTVFRSFSLAPRAGGRQGAARAAPPNKGNSVNANSPLSVTTPVMRSQPSTPDMHLLDRLPHRDFLELETGETAPRAARQRIARVLRQWELPHLEMASSLVATELVTNAVVATRAERWASAIPPVLLWVCGGPSLVALLAWDATVTAPTPRNAGDDDESGRGLAIVAGLSAACGYYYPAGRAGKVTWALIDTP